MLPDSLAVGPTGRRGPSMTVTCFPCGKRDSIHHHLLEVIFETATVPELRQKLLYPPLGGGGGCGGGVLS